MTARRPKGITTDETIAEEVSSAGANAHDRILELRAEVDRLCELATDVIEAWLADDGQSDYLADALTEMKRALPPNGQED